MRDVIYQLTEDPDYMIFGAEFYYGRSPMVSSTFEDWTPTGIYEGLNLVKDEDPNAPDYCRWHLDVSTGKRYSAQQVFLGDAPGVKEVVKEVYSDSDPDLMNIQ